VQPVEIFIDILTPPARLIIVGAVHIAIPMVTLAKTLGFTVLVVDPRKTFNTRERIPDADELIIAWPSDALEKLAPDQGTCIAVVSHDEKLDNPALAVALKSAAKYVGVLGTKRNIPKRLDALRELGVSEEQLKRLHAPIGLDLGSVQPEEIALSVLAEIVAVRHGRDPRASH
jgi:xanthine dehydrogenase accessory factor